MDSPIKLADKQPTIRRDGQGGGLRKICKSRVAALGNRVDNVVLAGSLCAGQKQQKGREAAVSFQAIC